MNKYDPENEDNICEDPEKQDRSKFEEETRFGYEISIFADEVHKNAVNHGWWENNPKFPEIAALIHSEVSEALEAYRNRKYNKIGEELADVILRILDYCSAKKIHIEYEMVKKHKFNRTRPYRHGNKQI